MSYTHTAPSTRTPGPSFLADRTVGKLSRWLRILGYDSVYLPQLLPAGLLREGRRQRRIILTRNTAILRAKDAPAFIFIRPDRFREQLKQVVETLQLDPVQAVLSRCIECNQALQLIEKDHHQAQVKNKVPDYVWQTQTDFRRCPKCSRIYWAASHRDRVLAELKQLGLGGAGLAGLKADC